MVADILTKDSKENLDILDITRDNRFRLSRNEDNIVSYSDGEITLRNRKEKAKKREKIEFENDEGLKLEVNQSLRRLVGNNRPLLSTSFNTYK